MTTIEIILGAVLLVMSVFLIIAVLMQSGKDKGISGTIAGGAETFFGKTKGKTIDKMLSTLTAVVAIIFVLVVLAVYVMQPTADTSGLNSTYVPAETTANTGDGTDTAVVDESDKASDTDAASDSEKADDTDAASESEAASDTEAASESDSETEAA